MKRTILLSLIVVFLFSINIDAIEFHEIKWGMSMPELIKIEGKPPFGADYLLMYVYESYEPLYGLPVLVQYDFIPGSLGGIRYFFTVTGMNKKTYEILEMEDSLEIVKHYYEKVTKVFEQLFGEPLRHITKYNPVKYNINNYSDIVKALENEEFYDYRVYKYQAYEPGEGYSEGYIFLILANYLMKNEIVLRAEVRPPDANYVKYPFEFYLYREIVQHYLDREAIKDELF